MKPADAPERRPTKEVAGIAEHFGFNRNRHCERLAMQTG
jgi:hypothetical protein